jgi:hypothetical protein
VGPEPLAIDSGTRFGRWTTLARVVGIGGAARVLCRCDCGTERSVLARKLRGEESKSCGCVRLAKNTARLTKHGHCTKALQSPTHLSWTAMINRCDNPKNASYPRYGGRGIGVAYAWRTFDAFLADMGERPPGTSLDRIDSDGDYEPGNCRWATAKQQAANRSSSKLEPHEAAQVSWLVASGYQVAEVASFFGISAKYAKHLASERR